MISYRQGFGSEHIAIETLRKNGSSSFVSQVGSRNERTRSV